MYLIITGGVTKEVTRKKKDGTYEKIIIREPFAPVVTAVAKLFGKKLGG